MKGMLFTTAQDAEAAFYEALAELPDLGPPEVLERLKGSAVDRGVFGAPGISPQQRDALVKLVKDATETPAWKATLEKMGWTSVFLGGEDYRRFIEEDTKRVTAIIDSLGLKK